MAKSVNRMFLDVPNKLEGHRTKRMKANNKPAWTKGDTVTLVEGSTGENAENKDAGNESNREEVWTSKQNRT